MDPMMYSYDSLKESIGAYLNDAANDFFRIGYYLRQVNERQLYLEDGYRNISEFAKAEYGLSASSTSRFMAINARFSIDGGEVMDPKYKDLGPSKLQEMLRLPDEELEAITPKTTVQEIRRIGNQAKSIETLAKQCEATGSCPDDNFSCIAGDKVGTAEGKELCLKCWKSFLKTHPDWEPGIRMEKLLKVAAGIADDAAEKSDGDCDVNDCQNRCNVAKKQDTEMSQAPEAENETVAVPAPKPPRTKPEPSKKDIIAFYDWIQLGPESNIDANELKARYRNAFGAGRGFRYEGSARGLKINDKNEITWNEAAKRLREIQEDEREVLESAESPEARKRDVIDADYEEVNAVSGGTIAVYDGTIAAYDGTNAVYDGTNTTSDGTKYLKDGDTEASRYRYRQHDVRRLLDKYERDTEKYIAADMPEDVIVNLRILADALRLLAEKMEREAEQE